MCRCVYVEDTSSPMQAQSVGINIDKWLTGLSGDVGEMIEYYLSGHCNLEICVGPSRMHP